MADPIIVDSRMVEARFDEAAPAYDINGVFAEYGQRLVDFLVLTPGASVLSTTVHDSTTLRYRRSGGT